MPNPFDQDLGEADTRRGLLNETAPGGAGALALSGCGRSAADDEPGGSPQERTATSRRGDVELLLAAHAMELEEHAAYDGRRGAVQARFARIEREHADRLARALRDLGAPDPPGSSHAPQGRDPLDAEGRAIAFYLDMLPKVYDAKLRVLIGSILAVESEQLAVLRELAGQRPAPDAFVYGFQS